MGLLRAMIIFLVTTRSGFVIGQTSETSDNYQYDYPAFDYNGAESTDYYNYDNSVINSYINQDKNNQNVQNIETKTVAAAGGEKYPIYNSDYIDENIKYEIPFQNNYTVVNNNYNYNNNFGFIESAKNSSESRQSSQILQNKGSIYEDYGYSDKQPKKFNNLVGHFDVPFEDQIHNFKHPFREIGPGGDKGLGLSVDKELTLKGVAIAVVFVVTIYLFVALALKSPLDLFQPKCKAWGWEGYEEYSVYAQPRFVPAMPVDEKMQLEFLSLFKGRKKEEKKDSEGSNSSEEEMSSEMEMMHGSDLSYIYEMCPKDAFFYGMAPHHIMAWQTLRKMFVAQNSPADVLKLAKALRHDKKLNPKVWYLGILAASIERTDMTGFAIAHPIDAFPDMFVPAHLIEHWDMDKSRQLENTKNIQNTGQGIAFETKEKLKGETDNNNKKGYSLNKDKKKEKEHDKKKKDDKGKKGKGKQKKECVVVDGSIGVENGIENKLWYWREDMMANQHHLYWHQVFPPNATRHPDRRSEVFFYMHRSLIARYNAERLSNGLDRTYELEFEYGNHYIEPYNSHLADINSGKYWTPRGPLTPMQDIIHIDDPDFPQDILINGWQALYWKFVKGIKEGKLYGNHGFVPIKHPNGLLPLSNTAEASELSVNSWFYDGFGLHNQGHILVALATDPDFKKHLPIGIMGDAAVSLRDPLFYPYHTSVDNLFEQFKRRLPPYKPIGGEFPLLWKGVEIVDIEVIGEGDGPANEIKTFYSKRKFDLSPGVDGSVHTGEKKTKVCAVHLNHQPFQFKIVIDRKPCARSKSEQATIRIFMAPRFDEKGARLPLVEQRRLMFPLDAFQVPLKIGRNVITRRDIDSALTIPWVRHLKDMKEGADPSAPADYCGCGWPRHLYIPRGSPEGMAFDLFVMATNFDEDFVIDDPKDLEIPETCTSSYIFCGIPRRRYPDARPMGYPFDRPPYKVDPSCGHGDNGLASIICKFLPSKHKRPVATLEEYVQIAGNMATISFGIKHIDKLIQKWKG